jgi:hypothetical protein
MRLLADHQYSYNFGDDGIPAIHSNPLSFLLGSLTMSWKKRMAALAIVAAMLGAGAAPAFADAPNGNSGHVGANANQCKNGGDHCPPFGH